MKTIEFGDKVRHKTNNDYNAHPMDVMDTNKNNILCRYFDHIEKTTKEKWFKETELNLISKTDGGFF
jgi:hypothetical protein